MSEFRVGDLVECVDARPTKDGVPSGLSLGDLYTVLDIIPAELMEFDRPGVLVDKVKCPPKVGFRNVAYRITRFRLIHRPDSRFSDANEHIRHPVSA